MNNTFISAKHAVEQYQLTQDQLINLFCNTEITIYDKDGKLNKDKHKADFEERIFNFIATNDFKWDEYEKAFDFGSDSSIVESNQKKYIIDIESTNILYNMIVEYYYFNKSEFNEIIATTLPTMKIENMENPKDNDSVIIAVWWAILEDYEKNNKTRDNDALPIRMRILLRYLGGTTINEFKKEGDKRNYIQDIQKAKKEDVPRLMELYPTLTKLKL